MGDSSGLLLMGPVHLGISLFVGFHKAVLGPLLFLIYINDLPKVCKSLDVILFADDTSITAINKDNNSVQDGLQNINIWLNANKLILNMEKTVQLNIGNKKSASKSVFKFDNVFIEV